MKFVMILFCLSVTVHFSFTQRSLTSLDVAQLKSVTDVVVNQQGSHAAFTVSVPADPREENKPVVHQLHLLDLETMRSVPYVTRGNVRSISFRPGHESITFLNRLEEDANTFLYEISMYGGEAKKIFSHETSLSSYAWDASGKLLAFTAAEKKEEENLNLPYQPEIYEGELTYLKGYVSDLSEKARLIAMDDHFRSLAWSPDGAHLVAISSPTPLVDDFYMKSRITFIEAASLEPLKSVDHPAKLGQLIWNSEGTSIAFIAGAHINDPIDGRLFVSSLSDAVARNIAPEFAGKFERISWSGDKIEFLASQGVGCVLGTVNGDGSDWTEEFTSDEFIVQQFTSQGDRDLVRAESATHPAELFWLENNKVKRLTKHNPVLDSVSLATQEIVRYTTSDGLSIEGLLIRPLREEDGEEYPLITVVHGGPEAHYDNGWLTSYSMPGQVGAAQGFAVFYPNYRGSTGRGLEFAMSSQRDLAGKEFDDVVEGVDHLIASGLVAKEKVGVTGGSYGGYATGWLSTKYTDRFAAGVMFVGISNNISKWGTSDIPEELYLVHARKRLWEDYQFFLERSPIYYADQAKTPLLIMHGKNDTRVHPGQSIELYRHIKTRTNTPVKLILYPGEGHGNRNATARYDYSLRQLGWFEKYLKGRS